MNLVDRGIEVTEGFATLKLIYNMIAVMIASIFTWLGLDGEVFMVFAVMLAFDYVSGVGKAHRLGHSITSQKMKYGVISKFSLLLIPLAFALAAKGVKIDGEDVFYVGMNILIISELYSIIGNVYAIKTKEELPEYDAVASLGRKIRTILIRLDGGKDV